MSKISLCDRCDYYAHSSFLVCAVHPNGPQWGKCNDFVSAALWEPDDLHNYDPEMAEEFGWHPIFTGKCPECRTSFSRMRIPPDRWRCKCCGWEDDTPFPVSK